MSGFSFSLHDAPAPEAAIDISGNQVVGITVDSRNGRPAVAAHAIEPLPEGALVPSLTALNVKDRPTVAAAVARVLDRIGRPRRVGLVVGDAVAKVSVVKLQQVPAKPHDLEQVIRWQVRKSAPFSVDDAQVGYERGFRAEDGQEFVVTVARRDVVLEYEDLCASAGAHAGIVDLSTFNVVNAVLATDMVPRGDWLLVNVAASWESMAIMRGRELLFFRSRGADGEGTLADLVHQTAMYYEDRLNGGGFARAFVCGATSLGQPDVVRRGLADRLATTVEMVDPTRAVAFTDRIGADAELCDALAPLVGLVVRAREAA